MKKIIFPTALLLLMTATGFASPLVDYNAGNVAVDVSLQAPKIKDDNEAAGSTGDLSGKNVAGFGLTAGLGSNLAIQYNQVSPKSKDKTVDGFGGPYAYHEKVDVRELNILYKVDKNFSALAGFGQVKGSYYTDGYSEETNKQHIFHVGFVGTVPLADKTTAYSTAVFGRNETSWKMGLSYEVAKDLDLNVFYGYNKYKNIGGWDSIDAESDFTVKGVGYGITYKFH